MAPTIGSRCAALLRWLIAASLLGGGICTASPALAATKAAPATALHLHTTAASVHVGAVMVLTGTVRPRSLKQVTLERQVGTKWIVIGHAKPTATGTFAISAKAPKAKATWVVRVVRAKSSLAMAGISGVVKVHIVKAIFAVTAATSAAVTSGTPVVVTGKVAPRASGTVVLQALSGTTWHNVASGRLTTSSTYALSVAEAVGVHHLRTVKAATLTTAAGTSPTVTATVSAPVPVAVVLTVAALPQGTAELPYSAPLVAAGGTAPYQYAVAGLPTGLSATASGVITGKVLTPLTTNVTVTVVDAANHVAAVVVPLVFTLSPSAGNVVVGWGRPLGSTLGSGVTAITYAPVSLAGLTGITAVAGSDTTGYALRFDGTVLAWGSDGSGALGDGGAHASGSATPLPIAALSGITAIAADGSFAMALRNDGTVWAWGDNTYGQGGGSTGGERDTPVQVAALTGVTAIAAASNNGYALKSDGTVWAWGQGSQGGLGNNSLADSATPVQVRGLTGVSAISARNGVAAALVAADGSVWDWGVDNLGQLGDMSVTTKALPVPAGSLTGVTAIAVGSSDSYAIEADGSLWAWGGNSNGQLGVGTTNATVGPVKVHLTGITAVSAGEQSVTARLDNGTAWSWGSQASGQLGDGLTTDSSLPVQVSGLSHVVSLGNGAFASYAATSG